MARKRSALIPIYGSLVGPEMGLKDAGKQCEQWFNAFGDGPATASRLDKIAEAAVVPHL